MYAGQVMEENTAAALFASPQHPYTAALLSALPERNTESARLTTIPGMVPGLFDRPQGCLFEPRCAFASERARIERPLLRDWQGGQVRCHHPTDDPERLSASSNEQHVRDGGAT